jgi:penicillin-binding protein 1A
MALRNGVLSYDKKNGYRGPEGFVKLPNDLSSANEAIADKLSSVSDSLDILAAIVTKIEKDKITLSRGEDKPIKLERSNAKFAEKFFSSKTPRSKRIRRGSIIRIKPSQNDKNKYEITQLPEAQAALVALQTNNGAIRALVGGFDFQSNKYNRVTQAYRQPGSAIKPFVFGAALEKGFSPKTLINDLPVNFNPDSTGGSLWEPKNFNNLYLGPISMKEALTKSQNMVSIRIVKKITPQYAQSYITRFGFEASRNPPLFSLALGAGAITPLQLVAGYSSIANGGFLTKPYFIDRILDYSGKLVRRYEPLSAGNEAYRIIDARHAYILHNMLSDVVYSGTARKAKILERPDLAGKTGTTNDAVDAWFAGYQPAISAVTWFGYDNPKSLGEKQTGSGIALPIWVNFMREILKRQPIVFQPEPAGIIRINDGLFTSESLPTNSNESLDVKFLDFE